MYTDLHIVTCACSVPNAFMFVQKAGPQWANVDPTLTVQFACENLRDRKCNCYNRCKLTSSYSVRTFRSWFGDSRIAMPKTRINLRPLIMALVFGVILPVSIAYFIDVKLGTLPVATIVAIILFMPFGAIWLSRASLNELDSLIAEVAPETPEPDEVLPDEISPVSADQPWRSIKDVS